MQGNDPFELALAARTDLNVYEHNAHLLYALEIYTGVDDIHSVATEALTDGPQDKKCDLLYINKDSGELIIAQGYVATPRKERAKGNKADDLNTAVTWILQVPLEQVPEIIRDAARDARHAIQSGVVNKVHIWYVHNCNESNEIQTCLDGVKHCAHAILTSRMYSSCEINEITATEVGRNRLNDWYRAQEVSILVNDEFTVSVPGGYTINERDESWSSFITSVPGSWLHQIFSTHGSDLFSANVRGYLGSRKSDRNINNNIKRSAQETPRDFWVFNNGITALVHEHNFDETTNKLKITGISIVNGAQTTGSIGSIRTDISDDLLVPARFVFCRNAQTVADIIKFNNSQNQVKATDFRSGDAIQKELRRQFSLVPDTEYNGGRRGGDDDVIRRQPNAIPAGAASQALAAFHQKPVEAYNSKSKLWESDTLYSSIFNERTTAKHIIFCYSLIRAIDNYKLELSSKLSRDQIQDTERLHLLFLKRRGAPFLFAAAISKCMEAILNIPIPDKASLSFSQETSLETAITNWSVIVKFSIGFYSHLESALNSGLASNESTVQPISDFSSTIHSLLQMGDVIRAPLSEFVNKVQR